MRLMIIAPFSHYWIVFAKMTAATISAYVQVSIINCINFNWGY